MKNERPYLWGGRRVKGFGIKDIKPENHQVTMGYDIIFATATANNINKDYPGAASVIDGKCVVTQEHYEYCIAYVLSHCRVVPRGEWRHRKELLP